MNWEVRLRLLSSEDKRVCAFAVRMAGEVIEQTNSPLCQEYHRLLEKMVKATHYNPYAARGIAERIAALAEGPNRRARLALMWAAYALCPEDVGLKSPLAATYEVIYQVQLVLGEPLDTLGARIAQIVWGERDT